ncbi:DNA methyltransferase [Helicobacter sp.]|uniref:DNA methyltransferase n=1 Tax=Helicobacter sp. TaxID=218 RepID=UPI0025C0BCCC|nr:DNA methyltransferase [Helicobacter sp.]MCI5968285.1 type I restriction enzyme HsdR N-terminal domain-containing protein [Helicobacter sp.]MDY2585377.1 DNA methyltransferase [Helicobacter sp.]
MLEFDFAQFENKEFLQDFKEDSVRELIIAPLLKALGFDTQGDFKVARSKTLTNPTITGSNKKIGAKDLMRPDYTLYIKSKPHCILDAKASTESINQESNNERQVFYYAINKAIKSPYYALCNGLEWTLFSTNTQEMLETFTCQELFYNTSKRNLLKQYLTTPPNSLKQAPTHTNMTSKKPDEWYLTRELPKIIIKPKKREKARHYGCSAYFTRQSWDIVERNIKNFTDEGDVVLDPFGGSGVTAIEAMMNGRIGIHADLNPLSVFITKALSAQCDLDLLYDSAEEILEELEAMRPKNGKEAKAFLKNAKYYPNAIDNEFGKTATQKEQDSTFWIPYDEILPKGSNVDSLLGLFTSKQLVELAFLRQLIFKKTIPSGNKENRILKRNLRYSLLLAFYNTINVANLTYHISNHKGLTDKAGDSSIFRYYRYRVAKNPTLIDVGDIFKSKIDRIIKGKKELQPSPHQQSTFYKAYYQPLKSVIKDFSGTLLVNRENLEQLDSMESKSNGDKIFQADATNLKEIEDQSIDFIYTDPPYGAKIPYLDLSTMWNAWLDFPINREIREKECIEKGSLEKTRYDYYDLMKKSLKEMYRVLKFNRWLAFVFQHEDVRLWQTLVEAAENLGFEYVSSMRQENGQTTFKKRQRPTRILNGQLIIYFKKVDNAKSRTKIEVGENIIERIFKDIEEIIVERDGATADEIWNNLIIKAVEGNYTDKIVKRFEDFILIINERFACDKNDKYHLKEFSGFSNYEIPLERRVEYFIKAILGRAQEKNKGVSFDDIVFEVIPLSKNGVQASKKLIREVLKLLAYERNGLWYRKERKPSLFDNLD